MDVTSIDPHMAQQIADLGVRLGETAVRNTATAIADRIKTVKAKRDDKATINELQEIIYSLIDDKKRCFKSPRLMSKNLLLIKSPRKISNILPTALYLC